MANSTSTLLQIVDMEEGANENSWGPIADANWTKLENAIANSTTINSTGGTVTLTDDQNRSAVLNITGTLADNLIIETAARLKWWIVNDQTTRGAYTVTIRAAGGTAIAVPAGVPSLFWCDGSEVIEITPGAAFLGSALDDTFYKNASGDIRGKIGGTDIFQMTSAGLTMLNSKVLTGAWAYLPAATACLFRNTAAPTGWTKVTSGIDNSALRVTIGTLADGGSANFTTAFTSRTPAGTVGSHTLTTDEIPAHTHFVVAPGSTTNLVGASEQLYYDRSVGGISDYQLGGGSNAATRGKSSSVGGGSGHSHTFTGDAMDFAVKYTDVIIATKD